MKKSHLLPLLLSSASFLACPAQLTHNAPADSRQAADDVMQVELKPLGTPGIFNRLEVGGVIGSTGLGLEVATPISRWVQLRAGVDWMPPINVPMHFNIQAYKTGAVNSGNFAKVQELMGKLGYEIDEVVDVDATPTMTTFKLLFDVYPIPNNRHWHITAGFYVGGRRVGKARNNIGEAPSLICMGLYNELYDYVMETDFIETPIYNDVFLEPDLADELKEQLESYGRLGVHMGDFADGTPYILEPGSDGQIKANAYVNAFRPYLGVGYSGAMSRDRRWQVGVDAGAQFWGGAPNIITHEGVSMTRQLHDIPGKVGQYVRIMKGIKAYPVISVKFSYTFF